MRSRSSRWKQRAFYHVMARGNRRNLIFASPDGADEELFLNTLGDCCKRTGFRVWAWVLLGNHYHFLIETPAANLVEGMGWLQRTPTDPGPTAGRELRG